MNNENIVKKVCKELGLTYKQLGEAIGYSEGSLKKIASTGEISPQIKKAIELYIENKRLKTELENINALKRLLKDFFK